MGSAPQDLIAQAAGACGTPFEISPIYNGSWASVYKVILEEGTRLAAKVPSDGHEHLAAAEGEMLRFLEKEAPGIFPKVTGEAPGVLLLDFVDNDGTKGSRGERQAGERLARLHNVTSDRFGFDRDTIFGPCSQPNPWSQNWVEFFRDQRLLYMTGIARNAGRLDAGLASRMEKFCARLQEFLPEGPTPALLHGDFWGGNILFHGGDCAAFIDPAIYYGDAETDLAFSTLFGSVGEDFFAAYREVRDIAPGFSKRKDIYNLWPLLFHAYWFGGHYEAGIAAVLRRLGF